jgi:hypothetical protein
MLAASDMRFAALRAAARSARCSDRICADVCHNTPLHVRSTSDALHESINEKLFEGVARVPSAVSRLGREGPFTPAREKKSEAKRDRFQCA